MKSANQTSKDAELILQMYEYALDNNLDISKPNDIKTILEALGRQNESNERIEQLTKALIVTDHRIKQDVAKRKKQVN